MRVITGTARGMRLESLPGMDVRPTTDKVKESIFNIVQFDIEGRRVLDLFAGSGQLGIEALSRGAAGCCFVDKSARSVDCVNSNLKHTRLYDRAVVKNEDSQSFLKRTEETFDLAFLDPPYGRKIIDENLPLLVPKMSSHGIIVCETSADETLPEKVEDFAVYRVYKYGKIKLTVYKHTEKDE